MAPSPRSPEGNHWNTTPSMEEDRIYYLNWVTRTRGLSYNWWVVEVGGFG